MMPFRYFYALLLNIRQDVYTNMQFLLQNYWILVL